MRTSDKIRGQAENAGEYVPINVNRLDDWADEVKELENIAEKILQIIYDNQLRSSFPTGELEKYFGME